MRRNRLAGLHVGIMLEFPGLRRELRVGLRPTFPTHGLLRTFRTALLDVQTCVCARTCVILELKELRRKSLSLSQSKYYFGVIHSG